jgi:alkylation response protein AidB-like acyl-CoA dehydrogenase
VTNTQFLPAASADTDEMRALRADVREFLAEQRTAGRIRDQVDSWLTGWDEDFSQALAARGWIGMTIPVEYGGQGRSHVERFVVTEELLAAGAPVAAHWIADRQIAPSLLKYGTELQKQRYLSRIAQGTCYFGIGMSEPDSGSDLASVRTKATKVDGGWSITGAKVWTSGAHHAEAFICLARSTPLDPASRHSGLSQFIVDLHAPGVDIRPILSMDGRHHFNEVLLDGVRVPEDMLFGTLGSGWEQVTSELGFERSGPERFLSTFLLLAHTVDQMERGALPHHPDLGRHVARIAGLHRMSSAVAGALERHESADTVAAITKVLGTTLEGDIVDFADRLIGDLDPALTDYRALLRDAVVQRPGFTLRGGTNEVLRGVIARGLGIR